MSTRNLIRMNRTGASANPVHARAAAEATALTVPSSDSDDVSLDDLRREAAALAEPVGSPPPATGNAMALLLDKLGDRLVFERSGTRLYEALLTKAATAGTFPGGPSEDDLLRIRGEEAAHADLVAQAIVDLGGDPTVLTPCANLSVVANQGLIQVATDPRTTLGECLQAILIAELTDNDAWDTLITVAGLADEEDLAGRLAVARAEEAEHLAEVRAWIAAHAQRRAIAGPTSSRKRGGR
jgi:hypothetical protein